MQPILAPVGFGSITDPDRYSEWSLHSVQTAPEGVNILPGGQSGLKDSAHFDDQAALWLANDTWPMRFTVDEVVAGAISRETFTGTGNENETTDP